MFEQEAKWSDLLNEAVREPGLILQAYSAFHGYSIGNQVAALIQCQRRGLTAGPINTYNGWLSLNRQVRKGERAIWLCMPLTRKVKDERGDEEQVITTFAWKPHWFAIAQTIGEEYQMPPTPGWSKYLALEALNIREIQFALTDGNVMGYATRRREIAVSPLCPLPHKTLLHEVAHIELAHVSEADFKDSESTPKSLREVEAESVALLVSESLKVPGSDYCRGYIQSWLDGDVIPEKSAQRIFGAADRILRAGRGQ
jgi:hypothetical protein